MSKRLFAVLLAVLLAAFAATGLAADPLSKEIENTYDYEDETIKIHIDQWHWAFKSTDLRFFVAHVETASPEQLQTAFAAEEYTKKEVEATSAIAERHDAMLAINGDYYNFKDSIGLIIRNGVLYRDKDTTRDQMLVMKDGSFVPLPIGTYTPGGGEQLLVDGAVQSFSFGPLLVMDGAVKELPKKYFISTKAVQREPRTAIGWVDGTHYVVIVADGRRKDWSDKGMTMPELAQVFVEEGCQIAYNLDGGGSATLVFNGERLNRLSGSRERNVSDIIYFTK